MSYINIRPACHLDFQAIIKLNLAAIEATAPMDMAQLQKLHAWSNYHKVATHNDQVVAFLLVLPSGKPYQSLNYRWFDDHYDSFLYVDRIVVDEQFVGNKIGSLLYQDLFATALASDINFITCEFNIKPLNTASQIFHQRFGFSEVATQWLDGETKQVSLQIAEVKN